MRNPGPAFSGWRVPFVPLGLLLLGALCPDASEGATSEAPLVDLASLRVDEAGAHAAVAGGGLADLTLDPALQRSAMRLLAQAHPNAGAVLAIDPRKGRVLAWAGVHGSTPAPSVVSSTLAPAASLFKIVTTTALLEKHVSPDRKVCIEGGTSWISRSHLTRPTSGHALCGPFREALGRSRNAVFAQLATRFLSREDLIGTAERLGFGRDMDFDVPVPIGSLEVPDGELSLARAAAGFVGSRLSPVGAAHLGSTIASGGDGFRLHLVRRAPGYDMPEHRESTGRVMHEATARELVRMMEITVHSGTCQHAFTDDEGHYYLGDVRAAGKTGTLQPDKDEATTSWFVGFAPSRAPRIVISVLLENGLGWRRKANEVGRDVLRAYFAPRGYRGITMPEGL